MKLQTEDRDGSRRARPGDGARDGAGEPAHQSRPGQRHSNGPKYTPAPGRKRRARARALPEKAKAYGVYCQDQSKKHVNGEKGTPFSQCVTAMAKAANNEKLTPAKPARA